MSQHALPAANFTKLGRRHCGVVQIMNRWLGVRIDFISNTVVFATALMVSALLPVNAGLAGLAMTAAVNLTDNLSWFVRMVSCCACCFVRKPCIILQVMKPFEANLKVVDELMMLTGQRMMSLQLVSRRMAVQSCTIAKLA